MDTEKNSLLRPSFRGMKVQSFTKEDSREDFFERPACAAVDVTGKL